MTRMSSNWVCLSGPRRCYKMEERATLNPSATHYLNLGALVTNSQVSNALPWWEEGVEGGSTSSASSRHSNRPVAGRRRQESQHPCC